MKALSFRLFTANEGLTTNTYVFDMNKKGTKLIYALAFSVFLGIGTAWGQSFKTITVDGALSDWSFANDGDFARGGQNTNWYFAWDDTYFYFAVERVNGNIFGDSDAATLFIDINGGLTTSSGLGTTTGNAYQGVTATLPINVDFAVRLERNYKQMNRWDGSSWSGNLSTTNFVDANNGDTRTIREGRIPWTELNENGTKPNSLAITSYLSYNTGVFGSFPEGNETQNGNGASKTFSNYVGYLPMNESINSNSLRDSLQQYLIVDGAEGWRMLSAPTSNNTYDDLLGNIWTQGIATGADATIGDSNVRDYDGSSFNTVNDLTATMTAGKGFITYVYSDDNFDESAEGFPKTLSLSGTENSGTINPTLNSGADAWSLVGNPYASTIDWDDLGKTDLTGTVYVYDHSYGSPVAPDTEASGSSGSYRVWNGTAGSLTDGLITAFQGFWVQNSASATSESLTIEEADKTTGGTFYKSNPAPVIQLTAELDDLKNDAHFSFTETGLTEKDNFDGLELAPLDFVDYITLSTVVAQENLDINNLPADFNEELEIPVVVEAFSANKETRQWVSKGGDITISWPSLKNIPDSWTMTLIDYETGIETDIRTSDSYTFKLEEVKGKVIAKTAFSVLSPISVVKQKSDHSSTRLGLRLTPSTSVSNEFEDKPVTFGLEQNYPNPFNPSTTIKYSVGESGPVSIAVYNVMGQKVADLVNATRGAGEYQVTWNASNNASGIYYYRLTAPGQVITRQMTLIK